MGRWLDEFAARGIVDYDEEGVTRRDILARLLLRSGRLRARAANAGEIANYLGWCLDHFGRNGYAPRRVRLWERIAAEFGSPVRGVEFGVALGYASAWWLDHLPSGSTWDGFDRFTGLPRAWRFLPAGEFDAGGNPPPIVDPCVTWHVGDIDATIGELSLVRDGRPWLVIFDFDIYEPSKVAWDHIASALRPGDVLYFDEAFDRDERHLLDHYILPAISCEAVGWTPVALALRVT